MRSLFDETVMNIASVWGGEKMILFFKVIRMHVLRLAVHGLHIFPVKKNRVMFNSYHGRQYSCSPKYISEYLEKYKDLEIIWAFEHPENFQFLKERGIKTVKYHSFKKIFYEATACVSVDNNGLYSWNPVRKQQEHINTWHGGGCYKKSGLQDGSNWMMRHLFATGVKETTLFLSSSAYFSQKLIRESFGYKGKILNCGLPRNDCLVKNGGAEQRRLIHSYYKIPEDVFLVLYAPTWGSSAEKMLLECDRIQQAVTMRFEKNCVIMYRAHYFSPSKDAEGMIDVTDYPDMQELLLETDLLITDYSSCIWDFSFTYKPCLLYTPDLKEYEENKGFNLDIHKWHFPVCETVEDLEKTILQYDEELHRKNMELHHSELGSFETGEATKIVGSLIFSLCEYEK